MPHWVLDTKGIDMLEDGWARRNGRRVLRLPDLNAPGDDELPGTRETRFAACMEHADKQLVIAAIRHEQKLLWLRRERNED